MNAKETIVKLSSSALEELKKLVQKEANNPDGVRLSLLAGGCSGLSYHMEFDKKKENDLIDEYGEINGYQIRQSSNNQPRYA